MSNNIPKKLQLKTELLRHLDTATTMMDEGKPSSVIRVMSLKLDIELLEHQNIEPDLEFWKFCMARG